MQGCPEGRFTSRVDFEIRAPQIAAAANAVLKYHPKTGARDDRAIL
jgi:hypothetical protein